MKLLNDINKLPYQGYTLEHGIERIRVKIPLISARAFEVAIAEAIAEGEPTKAMLLEIVANHGGSQRQAKRSV
jgi:hypothetical protein